MCWNVTQEKLRINTFTLQRTCVIVYETLMSQASAASSRGEGGARPSLHSKIFVFKSLQSWGGPLQTAQTARSFSNVFALFLTSLRNVIIIIINILAQFSILHRKKRGSNQCFRYEYFDIVMLLIEIFYNHNECDLISSQDDQIPWMFSVYHNKN